MFLPDWCSECIHLDDAHLWVDIRVFCWELLLGCWSCAEKTTCPPLKLSLTLQMCSLSLNTEKSSDVEKMLLLRLYFGAESDPSIWYLHQKKSNLLSTEDEIMTGAVGLSWSSCGKITRVKVFCHLEICLSPKLCCCCCEGERNWWF